MSRATRPQTSSAMLLPSTNRPRHGPIPTIPGFSPDPSICVVDGTFYLVTSSFHLFPGLPIYSSTDLRSWKLVGMSDLQQKLEQLADLLICSHRTCHPPIRTTLPPALRYRASYLELINNRNRRTMGTNNMASCGCHLCCLHQCRLSERQNRLYPEKLHRPHIRHPFRPMERSIVL